MRFATRNNGTLDGQLLLVSRAGDRAMPIEAVAPNLISLLRDWSRLEDSVQSQNHTLEYSQPNRSFALSAQELAAPLPRSPQWLDASAFLTHQRLMAQAFNTPLIPFYDTRPVIYQGASDDFLGAHEDLRVSDEAMGIDFEGEFGVVVDSVPMGVSAEDALGHVRLLVQINDWSLRALGQHEVKTGFGFIQAKPSSSFAPFAVTPDELGSNWRDGRVHLNLHVERNGEWFGNAYGGEMHFHFGELIAHAARTRKLTAGTIVGSGTVSNDDRRFGCSCIAERRVIEIIDQGAATTGYLKFGEHVRMEARATSEQSGPFGVISQRSIAA